MNNNGIYLCDSTNFAYISDSPHHDGHGYAHYSVNNYTTYINIYI